MKRKFFQLLTVLLIFAGSSLVLAQSIEVTGVQVDCPSGLLIDNGVEVVANLRPGFTYTATVVGIDGFDPILAVTDEFGNTLCADDDPSAAAYSANLPTSGLVNESFTSSQLPFSYRGSSFGDVSLIIGGFGNTAGEFLLFLEGMAVTSADGSGDGAGDPFSVHVTPNITAYGAPLNVYMISVTDALDPYMYVVNADNQTVIMDNGDLLACDDAGRAGYCWGEQDVLRGYYISRTSNRQLPGGDFDASMSIPVEELGLAPDETAYITWRFSSAGQNTFGDYVVVFHLGTTEAGIQTVTELNQQPTPDDGQIRQWASDAIGTSQYGEDSWSFEQATGSPNTETCGDHGTAWASSSSTGSEILALEFEEAVIPTQLNVYQTYNPGAITHVELTNTETGMIIPVPDSADPPGNTSCPGVFTLDIEEVDSLVDGVILYFDQTLTGNWNEIDAVQLVGVPEGGVTSSDGEFVTTTFEAQGFSISHPENWITDAALYLANNQVTYDAIANFEAVPEDGIGIAFSFPAELENDFGLDPITSPLELLEQLADVLELSETPEPYNNLELPAAILTLGSDVVPGGGIALAVEYDNGVTVYGIQVGGDFEDFEDQLVDIINTAEQE